MDSTKNTSSYAGGHWSEERQRKIPEYKSQIVAAVARGMFLSEICLELDISAKTIKNWRDNDLDFRQAMADAQEAALDRLDREIHRRAFEGVSEYVVAGGRVLMDPASPDPANPIPLRRRMYSDTLAMFIMKGRRRDVYGDRVETDNRHSVDLSGAREELAAKLDQLAQLGAAPPPELR